VNGVADIALLLVVVAAFVAAVGLWLLWTAGRLDRQHLRLEAARASLDAQLARRAALASEIASSEVLDPASSLLMLEAAGRTRSGPETGVDRWQAESELTAVLRESGLPSAEQAPIVADLADSARRAAMARRIHNDLAVAALGLHDRRRVRWFRLAGHARRPDLVEFDDRPVG
jgi:hypothetical protein